MSITKITEPGVYYDLPPDHYRQQHDWVSWSTLKKLVPPSTPAHLQAARRAGEERKRHFDLGKVVHSLVLGAGDEFEVVQSVDRQKNTKDAVDYTTVSAQAHRDAIYDAGKVPILRREVDHAEKMAESIKAHNAAHSLLTNGSPEVSLFWVDEATGVKCRARLDWLPKRAIHGRFTVPDLKTSPSSDPASFAKSIAKFGYYGQQAHYSDGIRACGLDDDPEFVFVVVEVTDPWPVIVGRVDTVEDLTFARAVVDRCRRVWRECNETDTWPAYPTGVIDLALPSWLLWDLEEFSGITTTTEIEALSA